MNAGRELDALVAEKVMGYKWERFRDDRFSIMRVPGTMACAAERYDCEAPIFTSMLPAFSTDIEEAWQVVEKVRDTTPGDETWVSVYDCGAKGWACSILYNLTSNDAPIVLADAEAETVPLAICRAALAAQVVTA